MPNHLIASSSPYLLQHAHNPVDWYPWGAEALQRARREDKPIFLSIGYAACHWCHVMEHESFENETIADVMNAHFINIKVDREERPDLDDLYMLATQIMTGQGGWPMSVWLTPDLTPFYAGTYFPPTDGFGRPGFPRLLEALHDAWQNRRTDLLAQAQKVVEAIRLHADESSAEDSDTANSPIENQKSKIENPPWLRLAVEQLSDRFDQVHGGLGSAPKFPPHQALQLWLAILANADPHRTGVAAADQRIVAGQVQRTLDAMKDGGIYDHVGGAFARYSTDEQWLVPHFEKMLYDNAQLAPVYAQASLLLDNPDYARIARETLDFFLREMRSPEGAFFSSLDADSEGVEGKYYVWTAQDVREALPDADDAELMLAHLGITPEGNWHESPVPGGCVPTVTASVDSLAQQHTISAEAMRRRLTALLEKLRHFRDRRPRPNLDDKILTSWNGLMLSALAQTGRLLQEERFLTAATQLADFLLHHHNTPASLQRVSRGGAPAHTPGFLDDHAFLLNGLLDLMQARPAQADTWRPPAEALAQHLLEDFQDQAHGGFFFTGPQHEQLFCRMKNAADNATPSANGIAIRALLRLSVLTGQPQYAAAAHRAVLAFRAAITRRPEYFPTILTALLESSAADASLPANTAPANAPATSAILQLAADEIPPIRSGDTFQIKLRLTIPPDYHIPAPSPTATPITAHVRSLGEAALAVQQWHFPPLQNLAEGPGYAGQIELAVTCTPDPDITPGDHTLRVVVSAQCCTRNACLPQEQTSLDLRLTIL